MIDLRDVCFSYQGGREILHDISLNMESGHCVAILGNNGAGKSTLLRCLNRILKPDRGEIILCERNLREMKRREIAQNTAYVEQHSEIGQFTVFDAVLLGRKPYIRMEPTQRDMQIVRETIDRLELGDYALRPLNQLSGGELQKVMIARAVAQQPKVLLLDEPTSSLDLRNQHEVMRLAREIAVRDSILVVVVIHDLNLAARYCDRFVFLRGGSVYAVGDDRILTNEVISAVYGVTAEVVEAHGRKVILAQLEDEEDLYDYRGTVAEVH